MKMSCRYCGTSSLELVLDLPVSSSSMGFHASPTWFLRPASYVSTSTWMTKEDNYGPGNHGGGFSAKFRVGGCRPQFENVTVG